MFYTYTNTIISNCIFFPIWRIHRYTQHKHMYTPNHNPAFYTLVGEISTTIVNHLEQNRLYQAQSTKHARKMDNTSLLTNQVPSFLHTMTNLSTLCKPTICQISQHSKNLIGQMGRRHHQFDDVIILCSHWTIQNLDHQYNMHVWFKQPARCSDIAQWRDLHR